MPLHARKCTAFIPAAFHARPQAMQLLPFALHISYSCTLSFKIFCEHGKHFTFCARLRHFDRVRCRSVCGIHCIHCGGFSRKQTMLRLLFALHIFVQLHSVFQNVLRHVNSSAFCAAFVIDCVGCRFCARNALHSFRRLISLVRRQIMPLMPFALHIFVLLHAVFQNVLRHGNSSAFCAPPSSLTAEDVASVRGILCIHAGGFSRSPAFVIDRGRSSSVRGMLCIPSGGLSRSPAHKRCYFRCLRYIFRTAVRCILNVLRARQPFRFSRSLAFAIDRVGCSFCARNALHSFQLLLMLVSDAASAVCATYFVQRTRGLSKCSAARQ